MPNLRRYYLRNSIGLYGFLFLHVSVLLWCLWPASFTFQLTSAEDASSVSAEIREASPVSIKDEVMSSVPPKTDQIERREIKFSLVYFRLALKRCDRLFERFRMNIRPSPWAACIGSALVHINLSDMTLWPLHAAADGRPAAQRSVYPNHLIVT